jgi:alpha-tubulin suppressor-like RCC1 family protein
VTAVAGGNKHTVFLLEDGSVMAVGHNAFGQLGDGTQTNRSTAVAVGGLGQRVTAVAGGGGHTVFLLEDGSVMAVGCNTFGQLGDGTQTNRSTAVAVGGLGQRVTAVAGGGAHTVFLLEDGSVMAVGHNAFGQLGDGTQTNQSTAVAVGGLGQRVTALTGGNKHTVFLLEDGSVMAVGCNAFGQLGDGTQTNRSTAVAVGGLGQRMTAVAGGGGHTVFLLEDGSVMAVGYNAFGQLGDGTQTNRSTAVAVGGLGQRVTAVAGGNKHTVFLLEDGSVMAVGENDCGQLGDGTQTNRSTAVAILPPGARPAACIAAGGTFSLVLQ